MQGQSFDQIRNALGMYPNAEQLLGLVVGVCIFLGIGHCVMDQHLI
jgi:hypothetical protein